MAAYWLVKSEPNDYSFNDLERDERTVWDGVRNAVALKHMRRVRPGDQVFFYHTGKERAIVGIARVESEAYADPEAENERFVVFEVSALRRLAQPLTLDRIKASGRFEGWELVRVPRLSVMPVPEKHWHRLIEMSEA